MSTNSLSSDAASESSSVYHSCREGDSTDVDAASFKSFSTQSISTLNSYRSALSEFSSATGGFVSAREDESSDDDCLTLQGDEFGFDGSECSTPVQSRKSTPDSPRRSPTPTPTPTPTPVIEETVLPLREEVLAVAAEPVVEIQDEEIESSSDSEETRMMMEKSVFSTATVLERSVIEIPPIPENPDPPTSPNVASTALCCWKSPLIVIAAVATMTAVQLIMRSVMSTDFRWWKLVVIRGLVQVAIAGSLVFKRRFFRRHENLSSFFPTECDFNLRSNGWTYFCQAVLSFVFIASTVECAKQVASPALSSVCYLLPLAFVFVDVAKTRIVPKVMVLLSSGTLIASALLLTLPRNRCGIESPDDCASSNSTWASPFFNADLVYGWPIDPRHQGEDFHQMTASAVVVRITFIVLSLGSTILSLITLNNRSQLDSYLVLLCQGFGALLYAIMDAREWQSLDYPTMSQMIYNLIIACLGISANFCVVILVIQSQNTKTTNKQSTSATTTTSSATATVAAAASGSGESNSLIDESQRASSNGNNAQESAMTSLVMSDMNHLPTMIAVLTSSQLLVVSFFNFIVISRSACCGFQDIFGVLLTLFLVTTVSFIGLHPSTTLQDVRTFFGEQIEKNRRREIESIPC